MSDTKIYHLKTPAFPEFRFEYHEAKKNVYLIRATSPTHGEAIANNIDTEGAANNAVLIWLRGYRAAKLELTSLKSGETGNGVSKRIVAAAG